MLANYLSFVNEEIIFVEDENEEDIPLALPGPSHRRSRKKKKVETDESLNSLLEDCFFYLKIRKAVREEARDTVIILGSLQIDLDADCTVVKFLEQMWLYVSGIPKRSFLYAVNGSEVKYFIVNNSLDVELFKGLTSRCFGLEFSDDDVQGNSVFLRVVIFKSICIGTSLHHTKLRNHVISHFCEVELTVPYDADDADCHSNMDLERLYSALKGYHNSSTDNTPVQHPQLVPFLRPYQQCAVQWMLQKEISPQTMDSVSLLYKEVTIDGQVFYYCKYDGSLSTTKPENKQLPKGGILADEMGLGKTVEVLALILLNPNKNLSSGEEVGSAACEFEAAESSKSEDDLYIPRASSSRSSAQNVRASDISKVSKSPRKKAKMKEALKKVRDMNESEREKEKGSQGMSFKLLEKWYNNLLSETVRRVPASHVNACVDFTGLKCVCGEVKKKWPKIQCTVCADWQHMKCMGFPSKGGYTCPQCWMSKDNVDSGATLIVSPSSISNQWLTESQKHIDDPNFRVLVYRGVRKHGFLQPTAIARNNIVLTTYEILRRELVHADVSLEEQPKLRHSKRFCIVPSPLTFVNWWRVCLDEAQMVEKTTSKTAEMARRFNSVHRWAITGTPIQKTVQDLFGLFQFLGVEPYTSLQLWNRVLYIPYCQGDTEPLFEVLKQVMWRTMKKDVVHEIGLPEQKHVVHWLYFSPVEEHFYRLQHLMCSQHFIMMCSKLEKLDTPKKSLNRVFLHKLLIPLLRLRHACSHHNAVRGCQITQKASMTMEELLESLIKKTKVEAEEGLRKTIAALNGIAGIQIIKELCVEAVESYREVLRLQDHYKDILKSDTLQRIHTFHNLAELLVTHREEIPPTLRDHLLEKQAKDLEENYMNKQDMQVAAAREALNALKKNIEELDAKFENDRDEWWAQLVTRALDNDDKDLIVRVQVELLNHQTPGKISIVNRVKTLRALENQLAAWSDSLFKKRVEAYAKLKELAEAPQMDLANEAVDCHLRSSNITKQKKKKCRLCEYDVFLKEYESLLFDIINQQKQHSFVGDVMIMNKLQQGSWQATEYEKIMKVVLSYGRTKRALPEVLEEGSMYLKVLEGMKKEFKQLRYTWAQIRDRTSIQDELHMAKLRVRLRFEDEPVPAPPKKQNPLHQLSSNLTNKMETIHVIEPHEIEYHAAKFQADKILGESELRRKFGQLQYLKNLEKNKGCKVNPDLCPICRTELGEKWSVLQCGHCFCTDCIGQLMQSNGLRAINVKCPNCRDITRSGEISFVDISAKSEEKENLPETAVEGSYSTKIEAVVRCLLTIKAESNAKALVFSTWEKVLDVLSVALARNNISFRRLQSGVNCKESLQQFKNEAAEHVTALLIPVRLGSKGLNLTEATHVLLVDPLLDPADELQAVGRVHRIGQTKETIVHHFLMRRTVEERIYEATKANAEKWSDNCVTIQQLRDLFTSSGNVISEPVDVVDVEGDLGFFRDYDLE